MAVCYEAWDDFIDDADEESLEFVVYTVGLFDKPADGPKTVIREEVSPRDCSVVRLECTANESRPMEAEGWCVKVFGNMRGSFV